MEQPEGRNNVSRRRQSPTTEPETYLPEDDHQLRNPRPVSPRTITNYRTRDLPHRRLVRHVSPKTVVGKEVEGGVGAEGLYAQQWEPRESSVKV